ncbi:MAG: hypothetical protein WC058_13690, partial [Phycisphaeraceae bacterium]
GTEGRRDGGTEGRRDGGTEGRRDGGTEGRRDGGTEEFYTRRAAMCDVIGVVWMNPTLDQVNLVPPTAAHQTVRTC